MSSVPASNVPPPPKKSFAQVAAAANALKPSREKPTNKPNHVRSANSSPQVPPGIPVAHSEHDTKPAVNGAAAGSLVTKEVDVKRIEPQQLPVLLQRIHLQDDPTTVGVVDFNAKNELDTKSVASRTTITLDEKESLRPDDSASMQAAPEEDALSPSGSIMAESRESGDTEAKAFREQLNVIDRTGAAGSVTTPAPVVLPLPPIDACNGAIIDPIVSIAANPFSPLAVTLAERPVTAPTAFVATPDEKLLEALASPKDRLFVLKIEQDMIDFVKDPKEEFLQLPQTNSFYRMLSHKLADYYLLGHLVDESMTSVRIYRTPHSRLPPPLIGPASTADGSTPPPTAPSRKIMRRVLDREAGSNQRSGEVKIFYSQNSSKAPSDTGAGSGGDDVNDDGTKGKDKAALTREERENRYKEARARIFKDFKEDTVESNDGAAASMEKEVSRSSSASGMKKAKKPKKPKDDGFEARSAYSQFGNQTFQANGPTSPASDGSFYNPFAPYPVGNFNGHAARTQEIPLQGSIPSYSPFGQHDPSGISTWPNAMQTQGYMMPQTPGSPYFGGQGSYDSGNTYGSPPIMSFPSPNMANSLTPKVGHPMLSAYSPDYMASGDRMGWGQGTFGNGYGTNGMMYNPSNTGMLDSGFMPQPMMFSPTATYDGGPTASPQFFPPLQQNGFDRPQFNPRSQTFIPSIRGGMAPSMQPGTPQPFVSNAQRPANSAPLQRQISNTSQNSALNSLQFGQHSPNGIRGNGQTPLRSQPPTARQPQAPFSSTISKWGNPSTLPPKPPPPAISSPYFEVPRDPQNQKPLPPNPYTNTSRATGGNDAGAQAAH